MELSIPGFGESPFAPCNAANEKYLELCVRDSGALTHRLHEMKIGDIVGIRGPYGHGWPITRNGHPERSEGSIKDSSASANGRIPQNDKKNKNLLIVVGGIGLIPLRTLILSKNKFLDKDSKIQIFYGAKTPQEMLFRYEYNRWRANGVDIQLTVDNKCLDWSGCEGLVTTLFDKHEIVPDAKAFLCGPPIMYKGVLEKLKERKFSDEDIYLSLERRMHCGLGVCQHCAVGPYYTCKDGPVFSYDKIKGVEGAI